MYTADTHEVVCVSFADGEGDVHLSGLACGRYSVDVLSSSGVYGASGVELVVAADPLPVQNVRLGKLTECISGVVTGGALAYTEVFVCDAAGLCIGKGTVGADGRYRVDCLRSAEGGSVGFLNMQTGGFASLDIGGSAVLPTVELQEPEEEMFGIGWTPGSLDQAQDGTLAALLESMDPEMSGGQLFFSQALTVGDREVVSWSKRIRNAQEKLDGIWGQQVKDHVTAKCCSTQEYRCLLNEQSRALLAARDAVDAANKQRQKTWISFWGFIPTIATMILTVPTVMQAAPVLATIGVATAAFGPLVVGLYSSFKDSGSSSPIQFLKHIWQDEIVDSLRSLVNTVAAIADMRDMLFDVKKFSDLMSKLQESTTGYYRVDKQLLLTTDPAKRMALLNEKDMYQANIRFLLNDKDYAGSATKLLKSMGCSNKTIAAFASDRPIRGDMSVSNDLMKLSKSELTGFMKTLGKVASFLSLALDVADLRGNLKQLDKDLKAMDDAVSKADLSVTYAREALASLRKCIATTGENCMPQPPSNSGDSSNSGGSSGGGSLSLPCRVLSSMDPNDIYGPGGAGEKNWVGARRMAFQVECENIAGENIAHAAMVTITEQLDAAFDWSSFRFGDMMLGGRYIEMPGEVQGYKTRVDWTDTHGILVDVDAGIDLDTGLVTWKFTAINPETGMPTNNPFKGLLAPNNKSPEGEGLFNYYVTPKSTLASGTEFKAEAEIIFDFNDPIDTPTLSYTLDTDAPEAVVESVAKTSDGRHLLVKWSGTDIGSGVASYDVYVAVDEGDWELWQVATKDTQALYTMQEGGHVYCFFAAARDLAGNREAVPEALPPEKAVIEVSCAATLQVVSTQAGLTPDGKLRVIVEFSESVKAAKDWSNSLDVRTDAGKVDLSKGAFTYSASTNTLVWEGPAASAAGNEVRVGLVDGSVLDAQGRAMAGAALTVRAGVALGKLADSYAAPTLYDYNGDGKVDLLVGEKSESGEGRVRIYLNTGTKQEAVFATYTYATLADGTPLTLESAGCQGAIVRMADLTGDKKAEMVIGQADGSVRVFKATGDGAWEDAGLLTCSDYGKAATVKVDARAAVHFADMNGDGLADLLVGAGDGTVVLYYNTGSKSGAAFDGGRYLHDASGLLDVGDRASVTTCDVDGDGVLDLLVGSATGTVYCYRNYGTAKAPLFAETAKVYVGAETMDLSSLTDRVRIDLADMDGDGTADLIVGMSDGSVQLFCGNGKVSETAATTARSMLAAPTGLCAAAEPVEGMEGYSLVDFSWNAVQGSDISYVLRYRLAGSAEYTYVECSGAGCTLQLEDGKYVWSVQAVDGSQEGSRSFWAGAASTVPGVDADLISATPNGKKVTFAWPEVEGAVNYIVTITNEDGSGKPTVKKGKKPTITVSMKDGEYNWTVQATTKKGEVLEEMSGRTFQVDATAPTLVKNLTATKTEQGAMVAVLAWEAATDVSAVHYLVEYSTDKSFKKDLHALETTGLTAEVPVTPGQYVYYRITAVDSFGNKSKQVKGSYGEPALAPGTVEEPKVDGKSVSLAWAAVEGAKSYIVTLTNAAGKVTTKTFKTNSGVVSLADSDYTWTVQAVSAAGIKSGLAGGTGFMVDVTAPKPVTKLAAEQKEGEVELTWIAAKDTSTVHYKVQYSNEKDFSTILGEQDNVSGTSTTLRLLGTDTLYYRVMAIDAVDHESKWVTGSLAITPYEVQAAHTPLQATDYYRLSVACDMPSPAEEWAVATQPLDLTMGEDTALAPVASAPAAITLDHELAVTTGVDYLQIPTPGLCDTGSALTVETAAEPTRRTAMLAATLS